MEIPHFYTRYVAVLPEFRLRENFEKLLPLVVEHNRVVSKTHVSLNWWCGRCVNMVDSTFGHLVQNLEEFRVFYFGAIVVEVADYHIKEGID